MCRYNCSLPSGSHARLVKNVNGLRRGDCGGRIETGSTSRHRVSMNGPVPVSPRCTMLVLKDPTDLADVDVMGSPENKRSRRYRGRAPDPMQPSLRARTWSGSGNPAVIGRYALRPVALRPRLSAGLPLSL